MWTLREVYRLDRWSSSLCSGQLQSISLALLWLCEVFRISSKAAQHSEHAVTALTCSENGYEIEIWLISCYFFAKKTNLFLENDSVFLCNIAWWSHKIIPHFLKCDELRSTATTVLLSSSANLFSRLNGWVACNVFYSIIRAICLVLQLRVSTVQSPSFWIDFIHPADSN